MRFKDIGHLVRNNLGSKQNTVTGLALILALASFTSAKSYEDYWILLRYFIKGRGYGYQIKGRDYGCQIRAYDPVTGKESILAPDKSSDNPTPLPNGNIIYHYDRGMLDTLRIMDREGKNHRDFEALDWRIQKEVIRTDYPVVSSDGRWVAFMQFLNQGNEAICVMGTDGKHFKRLLTSLEQPQEEESSLSLGRTKFKPPKDYIDIDLAWSPDSKRIAYARGGWEKLAIYTMNRDGKDILQLTNDDNNNFGPVWSPNGRMIAYNRGNPGNSELCVMEATGRNKTIIARGYDNVWPRWSPDSKYIIFMSEQENGWCDICLVKPDGTGLKMLTSTNDVSENYPAWSPDGKKIAYLRGKLESRELCLMNPDGTGQEVIAKTTFDSFYNPIWAPK